ncbi:hypothetical protein TRFO_11416 [Tritrichomonas foetus]|uniref:Uncharacterized protein n=1 Tax=Tritrichomonas foetus TaxID=1144522 RepID=A0A1J4J970_9EUKA|nr:hypothetical protein TRFO_11416 [Tritrichomonas foetus]|eukprot:OHS93957.1 hypothetical protein TRFO_11416 [Tritrichomonas foetus]
MNQTLNGGNVYFVTTFQSQQPQQPPPQSPQQVQQLQNPQQVQSQPNQQTIQIQSQNQQQQQNSNQNQQIQQQQSPTSNQKGDSSQKVPPAHTIVRKAVHTRKNLIVEKKSQESSPDTSAADGELATTPSSMEKTNSQNLEAFFNSLTKSPGLRNPRNLM